MTNYKKSCKFLEIGSNDLPTSVSTVVLANPQPASQQNPQSQLALVELFPLVSSVLRVARLASTWLFIKMMCLLFNH